MRSFKSRYSVKCKELHIEPLQSIVHLSEDLDTTPVPILNLGELTLGQKNAVAIGYALEGNETFVEIILSESYMGDEGCAAICNALVKNKTCQLLNLKGGNINAKGAAAIGRLLKLNLTIQTLILEWNGVGVYDTGIMEIASALKSNRTLLALDLRNNKITPEGAHILGAALKDNTSLLTVDLRWNSMGVSGGRYIEDMLRDNHTLLELHVAGNEVDYKTQQAIDSLLIRNRERKLTSEKELAMTDRLQQELNHSQHIQNRKIQNLQEQIINQQDDYSKQMINSQKRLNTLEDDYYSVSHKLQETERLYKKEKESTEELKKQLVDLSEGELPSTKKRLDKEILEHNESKKTVLLLSSELREVNDRMGAMEAELKRVTNISRKQMEDLESKEEKILSLSHKISSLENDKNDLNNQFTEAGRRIDFLQNNVRSLQLIEAEYSKIKMQYLEMKSTHEKEISDIRNSYRKEKMDYERLYEERKDSLLNKVEASNKEIGELKQEIANNTLSRDALVKEYEKKMEKLLDKMRGVEAEKYQLQSDFDKLQVEAKHLKFNANEVKSKSKEERKNFEGKITQLNEQLESLMHSYQTEKDATERKLSLKAEETSKLQSEVRELQYERAKLNEHHEKQLLSIENQLIGQVKQLIHDARKIK